MRWPHRHRDAVGVKTASRNGRSPSWSGYDPAARAGGGALIARRGRQAAAANLPVEESVCLTWCLMLTVGLFAALALVVRAVEKL